MPPSYPASPFFPGSCSSPVGAPHSPSSQRSPLGRGAVCRASTPHPAPSPRRSLGTPEMATLAPGGSLTPQAVSALGSHLPAGAFCEAFLPGLLPSSLPAQAGPASWKEALPALFPFSFTDISLQQVSWTSSSFLAPASQRAQTTSPCGSEQVAPMGLPALTPFHPQQRALLSSSSPACSPPESSLAPIRLPGALPGWDKAGGAGGLLRQGQM